MVLTPFDFIVLGFILIFGILGLLRGILRELVNIVSHILAIIISFRFHPQVYNSLKSIFPKSYQGTGKVVTFILIYIAVLVVCFVIEKLIRIAIEKLRLGFVDRLLGFIFGALKGFVISVVLFIILVTFIPDMEKTLQKCLTYPLLKRGSDFVLQLSPQEFRDKFINKGLIKELQEKIEKSRKVM
ncbi:membrane protein required for colicin V production [Thermosulfidibacter takaii ABI70S6]|uniref:Membrane protein required for colicin V production n=1 Tax=Thermosulfidibacter takaii (strain DSM 17441 / JCM 13301 / NBRC 103674 / ABI70S6) TaxID=1298851 RepID=A0A0S3QT69_THET7|nr:CvpA family protein [Thermosulfidibacter takaii]BAT71519.1 membrane protein required for colicin V production [Thermosulfidibacter takaii ABI70S6]